MRRAASLLVLPVLALSACGSGKQVDTASYTCAQFEKSLNTKGDNTAGNFINRLRKQANLGQPTQTANRELEIGVIFACRGKPGSTKPADRAIAIAKQIKAGTFKLPGRPPAKKKSNK